MCEQKECYVAYIDILGFKNFVNRNSFEEVKNIFDNIVEFKPHPLLKREGIYNKIKYYIMSDSIINYVDAKLKGSFIALAEACLQIQMKLASQERPILTTSVINSINKLEKNIEGSRGI